ncbi:hypothetical protein CLOSBL3_12754 [Clostridiaceae bacterium BL-3]|jgi:hypothetical protein|nr:hypothetical protein CLOSBL3_12754 [Clostridiaceae bacterium BL-3]
MLIDIYYILKEVTSFKDLESSHFVSINKDLYKIYGIDYKQIDRYKGLMI